MLTYLVKFLMVFFRSIPLGLVLWVGRLLGLFFGGIVRYHRSDALTALRKALPNLGNERHLAILRGMYRNLGMNLAESLHYFGNQREDLIARVSVENRGHIGEAFERGRGVIILTAHIGNFELAMMGSVLLLQRKMTAIYKPLKNKKLDTLLREARQLPGLKLVSRRNAYGKCLRALKRNEMVGFVLDQNMTRKEGVFVDFFGRPACTSPGLAYMAAQSGAMVVPMFFYREKGGRHRVIVHEPLDPPLDRSPNEIHKATQKYSSIIETAVRKSPAEWIWIHRRWRTKPRDGAPLEEQGRLPSKKTPLNA